MPSKFINSLKYLASFAFAFGLFAYLYQGKDLKGLFDYILTADMRWVGLSIMTAVISHASRAIRWNIALSPLGYQPKFISSFLSIMSGFFLNTFVPRLGEFMRSGLLRKLERVPVNASFGAVLAERGIDLLMLLLLTVTVLLLESDKLGAFLSEQLSSSSGLLIDKAYLFGVLGGIGLIGLLTLYWFRKKLLAIGLVKKAINFAAGLKDGILSIRKLQPQQQLAYLFHTLNIWVMYYLMSYLLLFSTPETLHLSSMCALSTLIMGGIGMAMPSPGGVGTYHLFVAAALTSYGLTETAGKEFAFLMHGTQTIGIIVLGGIAFALALTIKKEEPIEVPNGES